MGHIIISNLNNKKINLNPSLTLLHNIATQGVKIKSMCGGKANCGTCRIKILDGMKNITKMKEPEKKRLGDELIAQNYRLACQNHALKDIIIEIPDDPVPLNSFFTEK